MTQATTPSAAALHAVLFDRDDTLSLNDEGVYRQAALWVAAHFGLDPREAAEHMRAQWDAVVHSWRDLRTLQDEEDFWRAYAAQLAERLGLAREDGLALLREWPYERFMVPAPGARALLQALRERGLRIGVLSNTLPNVAVTLQAIGLADLVDVALSSCALGVHKPDPGAFRLAAERLGVPPQAVLFVDDRLENVEAARAVGMRALLIDHAGQLPEAIHTLAAVLDEVERE